MKRLFTPSVIVSLLLFVTSCNTDENNLDDCSGSCTTEFKIITVSIVDFNSEPVSLDSFKVTDVSNDMDVTPSNSVFSLEEAQELGEYPIVTDGSIELHNSMELKFQGFIDSNEVVNSNYVAQEECCGVSLLSGDLNLTTE